MLLLLHGSLILENFLNKISCSQSPPNPNDMGNVDHSFCFKFSHFVWSSLVLQYYKLSMDQYESDLLSVVNSLMLSINEIDLHLVKPGPCNASCIRFSLVKLLRLSGYDAAVCASKWQGSGKVPGGMLLNSFCFFTCMKPYFLELLNKLCIIFLSSTGDNDILSGSMLLFVITRSFVCRDTESFSIFLELAIICWREIVNYFPLSYLAASLIAIAES